MTAVATEQVATEPRLPAVKAIRRSFSSPIASFAVIVITVLWTIPTFGLFVTSVRPAKDVATTGWWSVFAHPAFTAHNYDTVLFQNTFGSNAGLMPFLINSLAITIPATVVPLTLAAMAAYALAWVKFRGSDWLFFIIFALQIVPLQMALIPLQRLYNFGAHIGSVQIFPSKSVTGLAEIWVSHTMFSLPLAIFLLHNFISQLPESMIEAARVDGATHLQIYRRIVLPLAGPAIASFGIFQFIWVWNDLLIAKTFGGTDASQQPITARGQSLVGNFASHPEYLAPAGLITIVVPLIVFLVLQRFFVRGLLAGSVKG